MASPNAHPRVPPILARVELLTNDETAASLLIQWRHNEDSDEFIAYLHEPLLEEPAIRAQVDLSDGLGEKNLPYRHGAGSHAFLHDYESTRSTQPPTDASAADELFYYSQSDALPSDFWDACPEFLTAATDRPVAADRRQFREFVQKALASTAFMHSAWTRDPSRAELRMLGGIPVALQTEDNVCFGLANIPSRQLAEHIAFWQAEQIALNIGDPRLDEPRRMRL